MPALTVPAGDTLLHVLDTPGGEPSLLLLNGAFGTLQNWNKVTARLDGSYRVVRFDARGRGQSGTSADYSLHAAVEDVSWCAPEAVTSSVRAANATAGTARSPQRLRAHGRHRRRRRCCYRCRAGDRG